MVRETGGSIPGQFISKTQKWYFMLSCLTLSIIRYGSRVIGAIQRKGLHPPLHLGGVAIENGAFWSANLLCHFIILSSRRHGYPWPSLGTSPYRSSPLAGLQGHTPYPHITAECMFVLLLPGYMWGSIEVHHLWASPCFSSSDLYVWFV